MASRPPPPNAPAQPTNGKDAEKATSASGTNNQVVGVDEADIVKTDGRYVYLAANGALRIVEALKPHVVSTTRLPGTTRELFVEGDRAVVYTSNGPVGRRCTYGYDCAFGGDGTSTKVTVLDIRDRAAKPKVLGELKIPGFSTYIHRIDPEHLLSIGFDADDQGSFAYFDGVILQLFDVKNPTDPRLVHKEKIGTRGSSSEAATDHLAFNYFASEGLLAVPMTICEGGGMAGTATTSRSAACSSTTSTSSVGSPASAASTTAPRARRAGRGGRTPTPP